MFQEGRGTYGVSFWKFIRKWWKVFVKHIVFEVGEGTRISFWFDVWCGERALFSIFPGVFRLATNQQASVLDVMSRLEYDLFQKHTGLGGR